VAIDWIVAEAGERVFEETGTTIPERTARLVADVGVVLKGPMANPIGHGYASPNIALRRAAGIYAKVRLGRAFPGARTHYPGADLAVIREVTEDVFSGAAQYVGSDAAIAVKFVTRAATHRITRFRCGYARPHGPRRTTIVHKAATLKQADGLWLHAAREAAADYPDIAVDDALVDALAMHLVRDPSDYDILLAPFQYGDILADLCAWIAGWIGLAAGASFVL